MSDLKLVISEPVTCAWNIVHNLWAVFPAQVTGIRNPIWFLAESNQIGSPHKFSFARGEKKILRNDMVFKI